MKTKVLAVIARKGGAGKTLLTVNLAVAAIRRRLSVAVIDIDPQQTATKLIEERPLSKKLAFIHSSAAQLKTLIATAKEGGVDLIIIDTAPYSNDEAAAAAAEADYILVPCRPWKPDMDTLPSTLAIAEAANKPYSVVINAAPLGKRAGIIQDGLRKAGIEVIDTFLTQRVSFSKSVTDGRSVHEYEPEGPAARSIDALYKEIIKKLNS